MNAQELAKEIVEDVLSKLLLIGSKEIAIQSAAAKLEPLVSDAERSEDQLVNDAVNVLCSLSKRLPDFYRLSLCTENDEAWLDLTDADGNEVCFDHEDCGWNSAIDAAVDDSEESEATNEQH